MRITIEQPSEWWCQWTLHDDLLMDSVSSLCRYKTKAGAKRGAKRFLRDLRYLEIEIVDGKP